MKNSHKTTHQMVICANVFLRRNDRLLLIRRSPHKRYAPGLLHPVGGMVEPHEDPITAAHREVLEETGLTITNLGLEAILYDIRPVRDEECDWLVYHFSADLGSGEPRESDEGDLVWVSREQFLMEPKHASLQGSVARLILDPMVGAILVTHTYDNAGNVTSRKVI